MTLVKVERLKVKLIFVIEIDLSLSLSLSSIFYGDYFLSFYFFFFDRKLKCNNGRQLRTRLVFVQMGFRDVIR